MAEELTSATAQEAPSSMDSEPTEGGQSEGQAYSESREPQPKPSKERASEPTSKGAEKPNLYDIPEFRKYQSQSERTRQREMQQLQQQYDARLREYEARMQQLEDANLDDFEKIQRKAERAEAKLYQYQQQIQQQEHQQQANMRILEDMQRIHEMTDVPIEQLYTAESYDDAWKIGIQYMKEQGATKSEQAEAKREANRTVVGGGGLHTGENRRERELRKAEESGDATAYVRALRMSD